ncbi:hypothetical protein FZI85_06875 [Mycobacterium sp. CBMA293]|uniref:hypothetical protein n=2 Tax=Mycolicibacterium TaxID=1866885 RepID=UPI0012DFA53B|nr:MULTISPECIES: hypothetical protein [unclassified Mycolicibacterium]MUL45292.1 hypothetical protein [Mycolicibacterium sp. CBMA 360]MUL56812.1 hypothetical protein [Mycolicibacterium sp. CBMA 335]MUL69851.1 hypothetical protein [Mycolicibacterium sp. CBMA 311]MUL91899.1 hypothetical protein [Mycolicibacterium sp. CBMA 230]MUM05638.1 hypothetical protein [Mycolicibacterium sp. CBMA 213]
MPEFLNHPPIETATDPVHSAADVGQRWRALMGQLGFGERLIWFAFVGPDRRFIKALSQLEIGPSPTVVPVRRMMSALHDVLDGFSEGTTVAALITRPGRGNAITRGDEKWAAFITEAAAEFGVPIEPIFRANDEALAQVALPQAA